MGIKLCCIGKSGQIARALMERGARGDIECVAVGRPGLDLTQPETITETLQRVRPDIVVNAAAYTDVDGAERENDLAFAVNAEGTEHLAKTCKALGLPLIHFSTDYVFDGSLERPYRETDPTDPINIYGASKLAGEQAVRETLNQNVILRTAWVYSPFGKNFARTMLRLAKAGKGASVVEDQYGTPTNALDIAEAVLAIAPQLLEADREHKFGTYHLVASGSCSWADFAAHIFSIYEKQTGCKIELKRIPSSAYPTLSKRPANSRLDTQKLFETFGVRLPDWQDSVEQTVLRLLEERV